VIRGRSPEENSIPREERRKTGNKDGRERVQLTIMIGISSGA